MLTFSKAAFDQVGHGGVLLHIPHLELGHHILAALHFEVSIGKYATAVAFVKHHKSPVGVGMRDFGGEIVIHNAATAAGFTFFSFFGGVGEVRHFFLGDGQMLKEFEDATQGMKAGESKTFQMGFPADYHGKDVAGKTADFMVTVKKIESAHLPEVNEAMAKSLGIEDATVEGLRTDVRKNLEREVKVRLLSRNKQAVMDALIASAELDLPTTAVQSEIQRLMEGTRADLKQRGMKDADTTPMPDDIFRPQAERRVRLGLVVAELVRANSLQAKPEQVKTHIEELAASYEKPADVMRWYYGDKNRLAEVEAVVMENNVTDFVLARAKVSEQSISFDDLMAQN